MPRLLLAAASGVTLAIAAGISATRDSPAAPAPLGPPPKAESTRCPEEARAIEKRATCGYVKVPLDRARPAGAKIEVYFELYPRTQREKPALSTVLSLEGGPGYPTAADRDGRAELWRPVSERRDLLLVDLRGTGESAALGCKAFANSTANYAERAGRCAQQIGPERDLYSTSQAVQDVEEVLRALEAGKVDLYGDSYGTYAAQAFALRFPERLRSLTLDGAYPLPGTDPAAADLVEAGRRALELTCERSPGCPEEARDDPVDHIARYVDAVRDGPFTGFGPDGDGTRTRVRVNEDALVQVFGSGYYYPALWRELPAAVLAAERGDRAPILRLGAETVVVDVGGEDPPSFSESLYLAVTCHDYPQLWDPDTPIKEREDEIEERLADYPDGAFTPFTGEAWTGTDYEGWLACRLWPSPAPGDPPDPSGADYPDVPTLVLNGDLDTITTSAQAAEAAERFSGSTFVEVRNSVHVTALYDKDDCASRIYVRFLKTLEPGDTSCASGIPELHLVPSFATRLQDVAPADSAAGDASIRSDRQLAAAAAATAADVLARWWVNYDGTSVGLRGGTWSYEGDDPVVFDLDAVEFVPGVKVTGTARWNVADRTFTARVDVTGPRGASGELRIAWPLSVQHAPATLTGEVGGRRLAATMPAP